MLAPKKLGPKAADHPSVGVPCPACDKTFAAGDYTTFVCRRGGAPMPTDRPDLAKLADAVEQAAQRFDLPSLNNSEFRTARRDVVEAAVAFVTARRATLAAGYVEVLVSREAVEALRRAMNTRASFGSGDDACRLLARDLDAVLKAG